MELPPGIIHKNKNNNKITIIMNSKIIIMPNSKTITNNLNIINIIPMNISISNINKLSKEIVNKDINYQDKHTLINLEGKYKDLAIEILITIKFTPRTIS
jgi:hypothetical protein